MAVSTAARREEFNNASGVNGENPGLDPAAETQAHGRLAYLHRRAEDESMERLAASTPTRRQPQTPAQDAQPTGDDFFPLYAALYGLDENDPNKNFLNKFDVMDNSTDAGGILIRSPSSGQSIHVEGGGVSGQSLEPGAPVTDEWLKHQLELAVVASSLPTAQDGLRFTAPTFAEQVIGEHAGKLAGVNLVGAVDRNPQDLNPELAALLPRMERIWNEMKQENPELAGQNPAAPAATQDQAAVTPSLGSLHVP